jgi:hypothetical protein
MANIYNNFLSRHLDSHQIMLITHAITLTTFEIKGRRFHAVVNHYANPGCRSDELNDLILG